MCASDDQVAEVIMSETQEIKERSVALDKEIIQLQEELGMQTGSKSAAPAGGTAKPKASDAASLQKSPSAAAAE